MRVELSSHRQVNHSSFQCTHSSEQQRHFVPVASNSLQKAAAGANFPFFLGLAVVDPCCSPRGPGFGAYTHNRQFTTVCNYNFQFQDTFLQSERAIACMWYITHIFRYTHILIK